MRKKFVEFFNEFLVSCSKFCLICNIFICLSYLEFLNERSLFFWWHIPIKWCAILISNRYWIVSWLLIVIESNRECHLLNLFFCLREKRAEWVDCTLCDHSSSKINKMWTGWCWDNQWVRSRDFSCLIISPFLYVNLIELYSGNRFWWSIVECWKITSVTCNLSWLVLVFVLTLLHRNLVAVFINNRPWLAEINLWTLSESGY